MWRLPLETICRLWLSTEYWRRFAELSATVPTGTNCELNRPFGRSGVPSAFQQKLPRKEHTAERVAMFPSLSFSVDIYLCQV